MKNKKDLVLPLVFVSVVLATLPGCSLDPALELQAKLQQWLLQLAKAKVPGVAESLKARSLLDIGLTQYEDGEYEDAERNLQSALYLFRGLEAREQAIAHKHLAFIHCAAERNEQCRDEFQNALRVDPAMTLHAAEAGHPAWGPVFQSVKANP